MQTEDSTSYHSSSYGRRRLGRNRRRAATVAVLFVGLVIGAFAGRWSVSDIEEFVEADPPIPPKDPHITALDEFEGMQVSTSPKTPSLSEIGFLTFAHPEIWFRWFGIWIRTPPTRLRTRKRS
jgi:hypothetical protein